MFTKSKVINKKFISLLIKIPEYVTCSFEVQNGQKIVKRKTKTKTDLLLQSAWQSNLHSLKLVLRPPAYMDGGWIDFGGLRNFRFHSGPKIPRLSSRNLPFKDLETYPGLCDQSINFICSLLVRAHIKSAWSFCSTHAPLQLYCQFVLTQRQINS